MRSISGELAAAQKGLDLLPAVDVRIGDYQCGVTRPRWTKQSLTDDEHAHAAAIGRDGSVIRVRANATTGYLEWCKVMPADRDDPDAWVDWSSLGFTCGGLRPAVCCSSSEDRYDVFYQDNVIPGRIRWTFTTDGGANWSYRVAIVDMLSNTLSGIAAAYDDGTGDIYVVYTFDRGGTGVTDELSVIVWDAGTSSWGSRIDWSDGDKYLYQGVSCFLKDDLLSWRPAGTTLRPTMKGSGRWSTGWELDTRPACGRRNRRSRQVTI